MELRIWRAVLLTLLSSCLCSYIAAGSMFFKRPPKLTSGMKLAGLTTVTFGALHFWAVAVTKDIPFLNGCIAIALYVCSLALFWDALRTHRANTLPTCFSSNDSPHLVTDGPYRFVRHPIYCAYLLTWCAGLAGSQNLWLIPTVLVMFVIYGVAAYSEEAMLSQSSVAQQYRDYRSRTGGFVPNPWKLMKR